MHLEVFGTLYKNLFESKEAYDYCILSWNVMLWIIKHYMSVKVEDALWDSMYE